MAVGDLVGPLRVGQVAHGGHWVARHEGLVLFVRHALTDELVTVRVTEVTRRFARADVVEVLEPSPHRVAPPCPVAGICGGCDLQHVAPAHQRELKRRVVAEQLARLGGVEFTGVVEAVEPPDVGWRTRVRYHATADGWGLRAHRSDAVVALPEGGCRIAVPELADPPVAPTGDDALVGVRPAGGPAAWLTTDDRRAVRERAAGRSWRVRATGFWQVHPAAADTLVAAVLAGLQPEPGESAFDLYCGVGLFAGALVDAGVRVWGVEGSRDAVALAAANVPEATFRAGSVEAVLASLPDAVDLVVLDPPRAGAGRRVLEEVLRRRPRRIAYVACDPAALGRDLGIAREAGWRVESLHAFDLFPMTHHVETIAVLTGHSPG